MKWFKFFGIDYLSDPKMLSLTPSERSCWITLLCYGSVNDNGLITFLTEQQLMGQAGIDFTSDEWEKTIGVFKKFEMLEMIINDNGKITIKNWKKRQESSLTGYERIKRHRQKTANDNGKITLDKNRIDKNRIERESPAQIAKSFFEQGDFYHQFLELFSKDRDRVLIENEFKKFILYWTEPNRSGTKLRWEHQQTFDVKRRLLTWLSNVKRFNGPQNNKPVNIV